MTINATEDTVNDGNGWGFYDLQNQTPGKLPGSVLRAGYRIAAVTGIVHGSLI
jgi:hypothetical protein